MASLSRHITHEFRNTWIATPATPARFPKNSANHRPPRHLIIREIRAIRGPLRIFLLRLTTDYSDCTDSDRKGILTFDASSRTTDAEVVSASFRHHRFLLRDDGSTRSRFET